MRPEEGYLVPQNNPHQQETDLRYTFNPEHNFRYDYM